MSERDGTERFLDAQEDDRHEMGIQRVRGPLPALPATEHDTPWRIVQALGNFGKIQDAAGVDVTNVMSIKMCKRIVEAVNAHAAPRGGTCENCQFAGPTHPGYRRCDLMKWNENYVPLTVNGQPFGCAAFEAKEQK